MTTQTKKPVVLTTANFDDFMAKSDKPVLVDFWASWCGPCVMLGPILEEVASLYSDKVIVANVNVDENPELASRYHVSSIPVVKGFKKGKQIHESVGAHPIEHWQSVIEHEL